MFPQPANTPNDPIEVHYDCRQSRAIKTFTDYYAARRFYTQKFKAGKIPTIVYPKRKEAPQ